MAVYRVTLTERDGMENGVRCPGCGSYTSFSDVLATGRCGGRTRRPPCRVQLGLELVVSR